MLKKFKSFFFNKVDLLVLTLIFLFTLLKLWKLNGGLVLGEPDEWVYQEIIQNYHHTIRPIFEGRIFFDSPPLFTWLSFPLSLIVPGKFLALRLVSILASFLLGWLFYQYLKKHFSQLATLMGVVLFLILPINVFYSRLGLIEVLLSLNYFIATVLIEKSFNERSRRWALGAGISLTLALITKFTAIILIAAALFYCLGKIMLNKKGLNKAAFQTSFIIFLTFFITSAAMGALFLFLGRSVFLDEIRERLTATNSVSLTTYLDIQTRVLTPEFLLIAFLGLLVSLKKGWNMPLPLLIIIFGFLTIYRLPTERYFVMLVPYLTIFCVFLFQFLETQFGKLTLFKNIKSYLYIMGVTTLLIIFGPTSWAAFQSSYHRLADTTALYLQTLKTTSGLADKWVLTNYWPSSFTDGKNYQTTWLSNNLNDSQAFSSTANQYTQINTDSETVLKKEGGIVVLEELYSSWLNKNESRLIPQIQVRENFQPITEIVDHSPNWPFFANSENRIRIYQFKEGEFH